MLSPLRLDRCTVKRLEILMKDGFEPSAGEEKVDVKLAMGVQKASDRNAFRVQMGVTLKPAKSHEANCRLERLFVEAEAVFSLPDAFTPEQTATYVPTNCLAIVYGILRGYVMSACGAIGHGPILLPSVEIGKMYYAIQERNDRIQRKKHKKLEKQQALSAME